MKRIITVINNNKRIINNLSYLTLLQVINMVIPLVTYPYLIRVLGVENYGLIVYSQAIIGYLVLVISFGFNITATKQISQNLLNHRKISKIVSAVLTIKTAIFLFLLLTLLVVILTFPINNKLSNLLLLTMWMGLYEVYFPVFYFQGTEKMRFITLFNFFSKLIFLVLVFIFIKNKENVYLYPIFNGVSIILVCVLSFYILRKENICLYIPKLNILKYFIKKSYVMALAYMSNNIKSGLNIIIIKLLFGVREVAYFDLAMKVVNIGNMFSDILNQSIFPKISREKNMFLLKKILKITLIMSFSFVVFLQLFGYYIIDLLGGSHMLPSLQLLRIISFVIPSYALGALLGRNCLIVFNKDKIVLKSMIFSSIIYVLSMIIYYLLKVDSIIYFSFIFLISFLIETVYRYYYCKKESLI